MNNKSLKCRILSSLVWQFGEKIGMYFVQFVIQIILARLLMPEDFGIVGIIAVVNALAQVFVQSGFGVALVQKKEIDEIDCSSIFYVGQIVSIVLYIVLFFVSPFIASFYDTPSLSSYMRVQFIGILIMPIVNMQNTILQRKMDFKKSFYSGMLTNVASAIIGISLALKGYGVWALVYSNLSNPIVSAVVLIATVRWHPRKVFSIRKVKVLFKFGSRLVLSSLIDTLYNNIYSLVIGKFFNKDVLGYYNKGKNFPNLAVTVLNSTIQTVMFPALSLCQDDKVKFKNLMRRAIVTSTFFVFPAMLGLIAVAKPLVTILLTEKWSSSVIFLQLCCMSYMFLPLQTANLQAINAMGRSDIFLKLEIIKKFIGIITLVITIPFGVHVMVSSRIIVSVINLFINGYPNKKLLGYSVFEQLHDIVPSFLLSVAMGIVVWSISLLNLNYYIMILLQVIVGILIYVSGTKLFKFECFEYVLGIIKEYLKHKN